MKTPTAIEITTIASSARKLTSTDSPPRHLRAIAALLGHPRSRQEQTTATWTSNSLDLLRKEHDGLCKRDRLIDHVERSCRPDVCPVTARERCLTHASVFRRQGVSADRPDGKDFHATSARLALAGQDLSRPEHPEAAACYVVSRWMQSRGFSSRADGLVLYASIRGDVA